MATTKRKVPHKTAKTGLVKKTIPHKPPVTSLAAFMAKDTPTAKQYINLQEAYTHYNKTLFDGMLPPVLVTFQRQRKSYGYYWPDKLINRETGGYMAEIALAINTFAERKDEEIFSTLVHEMVHHWQQVYGTPSRNGYHNKEWANKMKLVGLYPSETGLPDGAETGQKVSHYIMEEGAFKKHSKGLAASIDWNSAPDDLAKKKKQNKVKYACSTCEACAWGKPELNLTCGDCDESMEAEEA